MTTAASLRKTIESRLLEMIESRHEFLKHGSFLSDIGVTVRDTNLYIGDCFESVAGCYLETLCKKLSAQNSNGTPATIEIDSDLYKVITMRERNQKFAETFYDHKNGDLNADKELVEIYLKAIDFEKIADSINSQADSLSDKGLNLFAKRLLKSSIWDT